MNPIRSLSRFAVKRYWTFVLWHFFLLVPSFFIAIALTMVFSPLWAGVRRLLSLMRELFEDLESIWFDVTAFGVSDWEWLKRRLDR
ncbi:MAG: hypothetical protein ACXIUZ_01880 [Lysobacteraceae bacterium]